MARLDQVEADQDRLEAVPLVAGAALVERVPLAGDPAVAEEGQSPSGQLFGWARPVGHEAGEALSGEDGDDAVDGIEPRPQAPDHLVVLGGGSSGCEDTVPRAKKADLAQQVVQGGQRRQVVLEEGRVIRTRPARIALFDLPHDGTREAAAWRQLQPIGRQPQHQPNRRGHHSGGLADKEVGGVEVEAIVPALRPGTGLVMVRGSGSAIT